jgi:putative DNA methylase
MIQAHDCAPSNSSETVPCRSCIGDVANWDVAHHPRWMGVARALVRAAHGDEPPLVVDPFAGGGSIPLEALRLGCDTFASDLNPVACVILKIMLEEIPRYGLELAMELRRVGAEVKQAAERELAAFYPSDPDGATPIAYLWARTVRCEAPHCGAEIPLARSFWLCKKGNRRRALRYKMVQSIGASLHIKLDLFKPIHNSDVPPGTVTRAKATCLCCGTVLPPEWVRAQLTAQHGGADVLCDDMESEAAGHGC